MTEIDLVAGASSSIAYTKLDNKTILSYLLKNKACSEYLDINETSNVEVQEIGDGNLNLVFLIQHINRHLIVKQALPYLRCVGESYPLAKERMHYEIRALKKATEFAPNHVPKIVHADETMCLVAMQYLGNHVVMRKGLIERTSYPKFADHISTYLANNLFNTSSLRLESKEKAQLMRDFNQNELRKLTENFVFTYPFMQRDTYKARPELKKEAEALWQDLDFQEQVLNLKYKFINQTDALIHGDLHTGSVMLNQNETYVIDPEFAYVGPFGFDLGAVLANLVMSWVSHFERSKDSVYQEEILMMIQEFLTQFEKKFLALWNLHLSSPLIEKNFLTDKAMAYYQKQFMRNILRDTIGFAGCKIARRQLGIAGVADIRGIPDNEAMARAEKRALAIGREFVVTHSSCNNVEDIITLLRRFSATSQVEFSKKTQAPLPEEFTNKFSNLLINLKAQTEEINQKEINNPRYKDVSQAASTLLEEMTRLSLSLKAKGRNLTQEEITQCRQDCEDAIAKAKPAFKNEDDIWSQIHPILKAILFLLASLTVIPALIIARASPHGYTNTFFKEPVIGVSEQLEAFEKQARDKDLGILDEGNERQRAQCH